MRTYDLQTVVAVARELSPFYREWYKDLPRDEWHLTDLPVVDQHKFWQANTVDNNRLLTGSITDGVIFKSGGTTGNPKFSVFTRDEWASMTEINGRSLPLNGLQTGDRVANMFYGGQLYASFLFVHDFLQRCPVGVVEFSLSGTAGFENIAKTVQDFGINVLAGVPTLIMNFAEYARDQHLVCGKITKIYFAGETMYEDQRTRLKEIFPEVCIRSLGYASNDGGIIGYASDDCGFNEHRVFDDACILEILDEETGQPIEEVGCLGRIVITDKLRLLMPVIRYPAGDRGMWVEPPGTPFRKFVLLGRAEDGARVSCMTLYYDDVRDILHKCEGLPHIIGFQLVVTNCGRRDELILRLAGVEIPEDTAKLSEQVIQSVYEARPMYADLLAAEQVNPLAIEWVGAAQLETNKRTGKLKRIIDLRFGD